MLALKVRSDEGPNAPIHCTEFHPDGLIFGTGTGSCVKIWDLKEQVG